MSNYKASSWGRTRQPKNIAGPHATAATVIAHGATFSGITATDGTAGYITENQRYLHVTVDVGSGNPGRDIEVAVYNHASGQWAEFAVINCDAITVNTTYVVEIYGADRVGLKRVGGDWSNAPTAVYAACSTF